MIGQNVELWRSGLMNKRFYRHLHKRWNNRRCGKGEIWNRRKDGSPFPAFLTVCKQIVSAVTTGYVAIFRDLVLQKKPESHVHNHTL